MKENKIPVIRPDDKSIYWLNLADICFCSLDGRRIMYHTKEEVYLQITTLDDLQLMLTPENGYEKLDRTNIIQMNNITYYDSEYGKVYFDEPVNKFSLFATFAKGYIAKVKKKLGIEKDIGDKYSWF